LFNSDTSTALSTGSEKVRQTVVAHLNTWENFELVEKALDEIVDVHNRYKKFAVLTQQQAIDYIDANYKNGQL